MDGEASLSVAIGMELLHLLAYAVGGVEDATVMLGGARGRQCQEQHGKGRETRHTEGFDVLLLRAGKNVRFSDPGSW